MRGAGVQGTGHRGEISSRTIVSGWTCDPVTCVGKRLACFQTAIHTLVLHTLNKSFAVLSLPR